MSIFTKECRICKATFYCGGLECCRSQKEANTIICNCVKCSLKSDDQLLIKNIKRCPKSDSLEEITSITTLEVL